MTVHVFEFAYGRLRYRGVLEKETERSYRVRTSAFGTYVTRKTLGHVLVETDAPREVVAAFETTLASFDERVDRARDFLRALQVQARAAAFKAAGLIDPFAASDGAAGETD